MPRITALDLVISKAIRESDRLKFPLVVIKNSRYRYEILAEGDKVPEGFVVIRTVGEKWRLKV